MYSNFTNHSNSSQSSLNLEKASPITYYWCSFYGALAVAIIVSNALILVAFIRKPKLRTRTNFFIAGLVVSDLLVGIVCLPSYMFILLYQSYSNQIQSSVHSNVYRVWMTVDLFGGAASVLHLTMISLERYYALKWPFRHRVSSRRRYYVSLVFVWCLAVSCSATAVPFATWKHYPLAMTLCLYCFPFCLILFSYIAIFRIASRSRSGTKRMQKAVHSENKIAISILLIIGLFWFSWTPFVIMNLVYWICHSCAIISPNAIFAFKALQYSNSLANPIVYTLRLPNFKQAIREVLFERSSHVQNDIDLRPSGITWGQTRSKSFFREHSQPWLSLNTLKYDGVQLSFYRKTDTSHTEQR